MYSSAVQPASKREKHLVSAAQPAIRVAFITQDRSIISIDHDIAQESSPCRLALYDAVTHNPDVIFICVSRKGSSLQSTEALADTLADFLSELHRSKDCERASEGFHVAPGVIRIDFIPGVSHREVDPERGFPAMLLSLGKLVVVAVSWPHMPLRTACRVLAAYVAEFEEIRLEEDATDSAEQLTLVVGGNFPGLAVLAIQSLAEKNGLQFVSNGSDLMFVSQGHKKAIEIKALMSRDPCLSIVSSRSISQSATSNGAACSGAAQPDGDDATASRSAAQLATPSGVAQPSLADQAIGVAQPASGIAQPTSGVA